MPKIIIFGDIDITSLHIRVDGCKELTFSGKYLRGIDIDRGARHIVATSMTKIVNDITIFFCSEAGIVAAISIMRQSKDIKVRLL